MHNLHFHSRFPIVLLLGTLAVPFASLYADEVPINIPINNNSFEDAETFTGIAYGNPTLYPNYAVGVTGWTTVPGDAGLLAAGVLAPVTGEFPAGYDGNQIAWVSPTAELSQNLGIGLADYTNYTLSALVGYYSGATPYGESTNYSISLLAGTTVLTSVVPVSLSNTQWNDVTATFSTDGVIPSDESGPLEIIIANNLFIQLDVDDVTLTAIDPPPPVPDEGNVTWIAVIAIVACVCMNRRALRKSAALPFIR